jgi:hypothetical protein
MSSIEMLYKCLSHSFCSHILAWFKYYFLLRQFVIIRRFVQPSLDSRSTTKSMNIFCQICFNTGRGFKSLVRWSFQLLFIWHLSQFWQNVQTFCSISGQKNCCDKRASVTSLSKCSVIVESCVYWISSVQRDSDEPLSVFCKRVAFLHHSRSILLWILTFKTVKTIFVSCDCLTKLIVQLIFCFSIHSHLFKIWSHWTSSDLVQAQKLICLLLSLRQSV